MKTENITIIGSGVVGSLLAYLFTSRGHRVEVYEKGPEYPFPYTDQFSEEVFYLYKNPKYLLSSELKNHTLSGRYSHDLERERHMRVGGSASRWTGITLRMMPDDFKTQTLFGFGQDWPITYNELESYYCQAEQLLGVSGTDQDNPFAPPRSQALPLPPFELSHDDKILAERLKASNMTLHTTPQARTRLDYDERHACANFGVCDFCPMGALYSPSHHLEKAVATGLCTVHTSVSVRRIVLDNTGKVDSIVYSKNDTMDQQEKGAKLVVLAAGAIESTRLMLLSKCRQHSNGLGNNSGLVGENFAFHHLWDGTLQYDEPLYPARIGAITGQSHQFLAPAERGIVGGIKVEFTSTPGFRDFPKEWVPKDELMAQMDKMIRSRKIILHAETAPDSAKRITLSEKHDKFGDPFAHIHYDTTEFDQRTHGFAQEIFNQFASATRGEKVSLDDVQEFDSGAHHMGGCRMGTDVSNSVVNDFGKVHGADNLFVLGAAMFPGTSGAVNPTLTLAALALRAADYIFDQYLTKL